MRIVRAGACACACACICVRVCICRAGCMAERLEDQLLEESDVVCVITNNHEIF